MIAEEELRYQNKSAKRKVSATLQKLLDKIDFFKAKLDTLHPLDPFRITKALELEYTFESNRIEGNTMTLAETDLAINQGQTISGKSIREHLEVINHQEAIAYIRDLAQKNTSVNEREILSIHNLILRGIHPEDAGRYRKVQVMLQVSSHTPPQPEMIPKEMEDFFIWVETNKTSLHPIVLAAEIHERLITIHPFIDGNGRTCRLVMNLILLQHGYSIANIKGDDDSKKQYYQTLETAQTKKNTEDFLLFIAQSEKESLERYLNIIGQ